MTFTQLAKKKKNSMPATLTSDVTAVATTIPVSHLEYFHDADGVLITSGIVLGFDNAIRSLPEEITITGASSTSGTGNLTGAVRGLNADGTIGVGYAWPSGTSIAVMGMTTGDWNKITDNFAALPQSHNAIINGDCRVNQRVTVQTLVKDQYTWDVDDLTGPDRHEGMATGTAVSAGTWGQTLTATAGHSGSAFCFTGVTLTGAGVLWHRHRIEAKNAMRFKNQIVSFGCYVWQDTGSAHNYTIYIRKANAADNFSAVTAIANSAAQSVPSGGVAPGTFIKFENVSVGDCSNGLEVEIKNECGAITTKNFCQTELQLELGSVATVFEYRNIGLELVLSERYYEKSFGSTVAPAGATGLTGDGVIYYMFPSGITFRVTPVMFKTRKRVQPTTYVYSPAPGGSVGQIWAEDIGGGNSGNIAATSVNQGQYGFAIFTSALASTNHITQAHFVAVCEL